MNRSSTPIGRQFFFLCIILCFWLMGSGLTLAANAKFELKKDKSDIGGQVLDEEGKPLPFATVMLFSVADSAMVKAGFTDEEGRFTLVQIGEGEYWLEVKFTGLETYKGATFKFSGNEPKEVGPISLLPSGKELEAVKIVAEKPMVQVKPDMTIFNVEGTINAIGSTAFDLLRKAPGVMVDNNDNVLLMGKNGTRIYIDGKPSPLGSADLAGLLKTMQSTEIESIEIISNPSAKYDAEGNAGIINIKLKKDRNLGANGTLTLGYAIGRYSKYNGSASGNYRNKLVNAFGSYGTNLGTTFHEMNFHREQNGGAYDQHTYNRRNSQSHNFKAGADFFLGKKHTFGVMGSGFVFRGDFRNESSTILSTLATGQTNSILVAFNDQKEGRNNYNGNLNYRYDDGKGITWNVDADYGRFDINTDSWQPNYYFDSTRSYVMEEKIFSSYSPTDINIWTLKTDHERPLLGGTLAAGAKFSYVITGNDYQFNDVIGGEELLNTDRSNEFVYTENVNALYFSYQRTLKKFTLLAGLRAEQTNSLGNLTSIQATGNERVERHYISFFPSGGLTWNPHQKHSLRLNYSRRIDRPRYQDLNPFEYKIDELSYRRGNPFLQPQFTHAVSLTHTFNYTLNTSLNYSLTEDFFTEITDTVEGTRSYLTKANLATQQVISANVSYPWSPLKWWSTFTNTSVFYLQNKADFGEGKTIDVGRVTFSLYHQSTFNLPLDFSIQLSGFYTSPSIWGANFLNQKFWSIDGGVQKKFFKGNATLALSVSDIFLSQHWYAVQEFGGLYLSGDGGWESRQFKANFSWNFGNNQVKSRKRKTGLEDEKGRVGNE